jgi:DNA ligase (NAD+)
MVLDLHSQELNELKNLGFNVNPLNSVANSLEQVWAYYQKIEKDRNNLNYPIDGLVVKANSNLLFKKLGVVGKTPRTWSALKFEAEEVVSRVIGLDYQVGRTGKITPVVNIEPVMIQGTTVKRASLHNIQELIGYDLHIKDTLIVRKAGDIIPEVVNILENLRVANEPRIPIVSNCPVCGTGLEKTKTEIDYFCPNKLDCKDQIKLRLAYYCSRSVANIDGLSDKTIEKLISILDIKDIADLYTLDYKTIEGLEGFGDKSIYNLKTQILKASNLLDYKFLTGLGIEGVGAENAKIITKYLNSL